MTGCRAGELTALRWSDWTGDVLQITHSVSLTGEGKKIITDPKSDTSSRILKLDSQSVAVLSAWQKYQYCWRMRVGNYYSDRNLIFRMPLEASCQPPISLGDIGIHYWHR